MQPASLPLEGITVVEFSTSVAGPFAGMVLAELGAEVIKIENPQGGDDARRWGPPFVDGVAPVFNALNRNKRSATVDLKDESDREKLRDFIRERADVVLQNMRPGLVEKYSMDAKSLRAANAGLIYCNMHAFGAVGPRRMQPGYDPLMQACGGIMSVTGLEGEEPVRVGPSIIDQGTGMWAVIGILAALQERNNTGQGRIVDTSLYETAIGWLPAQIATLLASGKVPRKIGSENAGIAPYKAFQASDGWLIIAAGNDKLFSRLAAVLNDDQLAGDPRFATNPQRVENRQVLNASIQEIIRYDTRDGWLRRLEAAGVPCAPVLDLGEVLADEQFEALEILQSDPDNRMRLIGLPLAFDGQRPRFNNAPPVLGEANDAVFSNTAGSGTKT